MFRHHGMHPSIRFVDSGGDGGGDNSGADDDGKDGDGKDGDGADKGADALRRERSRARSLQAEVQRLKAAEQELTALKEQGATAQERAIAEARREAAQEATTKANARILAAEARAIAGTMDFHNPSRAVALVELDDVKVNEDGTFDEDAVRDLLKDLAKSDPYLVKAAQADDDGGDFRRHGGGGRGGSPEPADAAGRVRAGLVAALKHAK